MGAFVRLLLVNGVRTVKNGRITGLRGGRVGRSQ